MDRLIQQALHQMMSLVWEPDFSDHSYGFRPGRGAPVEAGHRWVVDLDLEKFVDRVNHDVLMARVGRKIDERRMLGLIRRYLQSGIKVRGWANYYRKATTYGVFEDLDGWLRRQLRCLIWRRWKRSYTRARA